MKTQKPRMKHQVGTKKLQLIANAVAHRSYLEPGNIQVAEVMEDKGEIHLTAEEHAAFVQCLRLSRKLDDMERLQLYFRGHTDAVAYLKKIKAI